MTSYNTTGMDIINALVGKGIKDSLAVRTVMRDSKVLRAGLFHKTPAQIADEMIQEYGLKEPQMPPRMPYEPEGT
jgi:hypothetical protein